MTWLLCGWLALAGSLWAGNAPGAGGPAPGPGGPAGPGGGGPPAAVVEDSGNRFVDFKVSVFPPFQSPGPDAKDDTTESLPELCKGRAYCRRGYYLPLVVNFYNQSKPPEEFDVKIECEINTLSFDPQVAQRELSSRINYYTEMHVGIGAPAEQTFSVLIPSDQTNDAVPVMTVKIRPKGGIKGYDRTIFLDDIDRPEPSHPGQKGSKLVLAISADPSQSPAFLRWEQYLVAKTAGAGGGANAASPNFENVIFTRPRKGFMVKYVPADWYALSMVNMILIDKTPLNMTWSEENQKTIAQWVRAGGVLVLAGPPDKKQWEKLGLDSLAGVKVSEDPPKAVSDIRGLIERFPGGRDNDAQFVTGDRPLSVGRVRSQDSGAFKVEAEGGVVLYHERRVGAGVVITIPWDLDGVNSNKAVLNEDWGRRDMIYERVWQFMQRPALGPFATVNQINELDDTQTDFRYAMWKNLKAANLELPREQQQAEERFATDLEARKLNLPSHWNLDHWLFRNFLKNSFEKQSPIKLPATRVVAGFLLLYLFLVSPFTYIIMRLLKRLEWAWPISILLAFLFALFSYGYFYAGNQGAMVCNEVSVVELTSGDPRGVAQSWLGLYSPNRGYYKIEFPDAPFDENAAYPLGVERAVGSMMLYDRGVNLTLAKDSGTGVNVTWKGLQPVMQDVYINDRSSQYFQTTNLVDFGGAAGGKISYSVQRLSASSRGYVVKVTNTTKFAILAPTLAINDARYPLISAHPAPGEEFKSTVIPAGAVDLELRSDPVDLATPPGGLRGDAAPHFFQQVPKEWEVSEFLKDRCVYLNTLSTTGSRGWKRNLDLDTLLIGWVNAPAVFIAVDGATLTQRTEYTGVMQLVIRKAGHENEPLADTYSVHPAAAESFSDDGHDPGKDYTDENSEPLPAAKRSKRDMAASMQIERWGGLLTYYFKRTTPLPPSAAVGLQFRLPLEYALNADEGAHNVLIKNVVFMTEGAKPVKLITVPADACLVRVETPGKPPRTVPKYNLAGRRADEQVYLQFTVARSDVEKLALNERYQFQVEIQIGGDNQYDAGVVVGVGHVTVVEQ